MKRLWLVAALLVLCPLLVQARGRVSGWCEQGNQQVSISGAGTSSTYWQRSHPSCTITVYDTGTVNVSTIYSDSGGTPLANPFTATSTGYWFFYAATARYDVVLSGAGITSPITLGDLQALDTTDITVGATAWSAITNPSGNLSLSMGTNTTTFTWGNMATTANSFSLTDGAASSSTGSLFRTFTGAASTMKPFTATAQGTANGVQMSSAGLLAPIGTGGIQASDLQCTTCVGDADVSSITTRSKLPSEIAYEDEANTFSAQQTITTSLRIRGGTANNITITGSPSADRTATLPDATTTLVGTGTTDTLSNKTFSDNLAFQSGTAFTGTFDHAISANRTWTMPNAAGTVLLAPTLTSGSVMFNDGTTLDEDNAQFFWNTSTKRLGIGNASPCCSLHVQPRATASEVAMRVQGDSTANTDVLQVYNSAASPAKISFFGSNGALNTALGITSTLATGTAPMVIASTTKVANLNVDLLDGGDWAAPVAIGTTTPAAATFTTVTANTSVTSPIVQNTGDVADAGVVRLANADIIGWEASPAGSDVTLTVNSSEVLVASGAFQATTVTATTSTTSPLYVSTTNCSDSAGDAACGAAPAGSVVVDAADTTTVVSTTAVTANSQIFLQIDAGLGTRLGVTCNTQAASVFNPRVTARTAATSFTITVDAGPTTDPLCMSYFIVN